MTTPSTRRNATVAVLALHMGGCSACAQSVMALQAPRYAAKLAAHGVSFVRSARQADIVLLSGTLATPALESVRAALDGVPQPHAVVAVGDCAIDGGVFAGSPDLIAHPAETLDVNVEIAGCPPTPDAILSAIAEAAVLLRDEELSTGDDDVDETDVDETDVDETDVDETDDETEGREA